MPTHVPRFHWRRATAAVVGVLVAAALLPSAHAEVGTARSFVLSGTVGLVRGADSDAGAERVVRQLLRRAGVENVVTTDGEDPRTETTIWLGEGDDALAGLDVTPTNRMRAEGYVLATGKDEQGRAHAVLDGVDADGTYYAARALNKLVVRLPDEDLVRGSEAHEAPAMRYRGVVEGFYGTPWSHEQRLATLDYLGAHRMNTYVYAPKGDPLLRREWRRSYTEDELAELAQLVRHARRNRVDLVYTLAPGLSICYASKGDAATLRSKLESVYALGVRTFALAFDDVDDSSWNCDADQRTYGADDSSLGRAQAALVNEVQRWVAEQAPGTRLQMVPTQYDNVTETPYKKAIRQGVDPAVVMFWAGVAGIPREITRDQAAQARGVFGHELVVWDNYPVNDYIAGRLPLGPYTGREAGLSKDVEGVLSNSMNQAAVSKLAWYSVGQFGWNDTAYDPWASWAEAMSERAGGDAEVATALGWFAELSYYDGTLHYERAPRLTAALEEFWAAWKLSESGATSVGQGAAEGSGRSDQDESPNERAREAAAELRATIGAVEASPKLLREGVPDPAFSDEARAWLDATELWSGAMQASLDTLVALSDGDAAAAWSAQQRAADLVDQADSVRDTLMPHADAAPRIGDGVVDTFVAEVARRFAASVGVGRSHPIAETSMRTYADDRPDHFLDGDRGTHFASDVAPNAGDYVQVDLRTERPIGEVAVLMAYENAPNDYLKSGVLEYSVDGSTWSELARGDSAEVRATAPVGATARYVRYRATSDNAPYWLAVREFDVTVLDETSVSARGTPRPRRASDGEPASRVAQAADDDLGTAYVASHVPEEGDAVTMRLSRPRVLDAVVVFQEAAGAAPADVQLKVDDEWVKVGELTGELSVVSLAEWGEVDAVRLAWGPGEVAPRVAEIVPQYAR
jgi:hyaluronoglucosaminidase